MKRNRNALRLMLAASAVLLTGVAAGPVQAQVSAMDYDAAVPCPAFQRSGYGAWTAVAPVTLNIDNGMSLSFRPGDTMGPGSTIGGVAVPIILDRHCGNM
jgi:hypothetical protein